MDTPSPKTLTRRSVLAGAAATGAVVTATSLLGAPDAQAATAAGPVASTNYTPQQMLARQNIKHVVFLMMENRSFDHLFGTLSGVRGFDDRTVTRPDGGSIFEQHYIKNGADAFELPYRISESNTATGDADLSHNWGPQHAAYNGGRNDNWIPAHLAADGADGIYTMGYLTRDDAPFHYAMADCFTVCDNYFCSLLGPTYPNRLMWQQGSIDPTGIGGGPLLTTTEGVFTDQNAMGVFTYPTFPERLTAAGITWQAYTDEASNHLLNMFPAFKQYNAPTNPTSPTATTQATNFQRGTVGGGGLQGFLSAVDSNTLPPVSWIFPTAQSTEHPGEGPINAGPQFYEPIIAKLMASASWSSTALFITWDENDGYFDHVPPPRPVTAADKVGEVLTAAPYVAGSDAGFKDIGLGFRVPNLVISPWSGGGRVASELFDHTSVLKLVETLFGTPTNGVTPKGIVSDWRYNLVGDLTSTFDFSRPPIPMVDTTTPSAAKPPIAVKLAQAFEQSQALFATHNSGDETPPAVQSQPRQESIVDFPRTPVGPSATPVAALPEVAEPALLLAAGVATAMGLIAAKRIRTGGASDASHAGSGRLVADDVPEFRV